MGVDQRSQKDDHSIPYWSYVHTQGSSHPSRDKTRGERQDSGGAAGRVTIPHFGTVQLLPLTHAAVQPQPHFSPSLTLGLGRNSHLTSAPHSRNSATTALTFAPHSRSSAAIAFTSTPHSLSVSVGQSSSQVSPHLRPSPPLLAATDLL
ncbi:hypothetical protein SLEP1_g10530 [Rubroshorea leprosula]|uniref:Uncharacterized protein n=1 Tax=Rubroshorea leprosula TaxID=152421 RepID=A0AAV5IGX0_9ROSI|nr:hypothetical protein SLEP1_g10530 [Rubroshorea leprosula]